MEGKGKGKHLAISPGGGGAVPVKLYRVSWIYRRKEATVEQVLKEKWCWARVGRGEMIHHVKRL